MLPASSYSMKKIYIVHKQKLSVVTHDSFSHTPVEQNTSVCSNMK